MNLALRPSPAPRDTRVVTSAFYSLLPTPYSLSLFPGSLGPVTSPPQAAEVLPRPARAQSLLTSGRFRSLPLLTLALAALTGCNVGPRYTRPVVPAPPTFRAADNASTPSDPASIADQQWSSVFREPELQSLIRTALANNYDLRIAAQRILEQQAQLQVTRAQAFPTLSAGGTGIGATFNSSAFSTGNSGSGSTSTLSSPLSFGSLNLSAAWTPDFWGTYRKQTEAARANLLAQTFAQRAVRLTLVQDVVTAYLQLRALDRQLEITRESLKTRQESVNLTRTLEEGGAAPLSDLRQAEQLLYTASAGIPQLEQQVQQQENALSLLLGQTPGQTPILHTDPNALTPPPQDLPVGLPSQLLTRRPDIQQAEQALVAANANIGVARAAFFPSLSISASAGTGGNSFGSLVDPASKTIYGIGSLAQPLFEGGKLRGQLNLVRAQQGRLVATYQQTIATAFREVSDALIALNKTRAVRVEQEKLVAAAQDSTRLARMRYGAGATSFLEVLTTDSTLYSAQLNLATAQQAEAQTLVQLYSALGGGWQ